MALKHDVWKVVGLQIASRDTTYVMLRTVSVVGAESHESSGPPLRTVFEGGRYGEIGTKAMKERLNH